MRLIVPVVRQADALTGVDLSMAGDYGRLFAGHHAHAVLLQVAPVEHAPVGEVAGRAGSVLPYAEKVLAADVERKIGGQLVSVLLEEADQAAEVVKVTVARDERLRLRGIDLHDLHVVEERVRRVAEIEQDLARLPAHARFEREREAPFVMQRLARVVGRDEAGAARLHPFRGADTRCVVARVGKHTDRQVIDGRNARQPCGLRQCATTNAEGGKRSGSEQQIAAAKIHARWTSLRNITP